MTAENWKEQQLEGLDLPLMTITPNDFVFLGKNS